MRKIYLYTFFLALVACKEKDQPNTSQLLSNPAFLVVNGGENSLSVIDPETFIEKGRFFIQSPNNTFAHHLCLSPNASKIAIALPTYDFSAGHDGLHNQTSSGYVAIVDRNTEKVERTLAVDIANHNAIFSADGKELWTGLVSHNGKIVVFNAETGSKIKEINVNPDPHEIILSENGKYVLVTGLESSFLTVIDAEKKVIIREIKVDPAPSNVWHGKDANQVIVENSNQKSINFVDLQSLTVTDYIDFNFTPGFAKFAPNGNLWICAKGENSLYIYSKESGSWQMKHKIETQRDPHHLTFYKGNAWLVNQKENTIEVFNIESKAKISETKVGSKPNAIVYLP